MLAAEFRRGPARSPHGVPVVLVTLSRRRSQTPPPTPPRFQLDVSKLKAGTRVTLDMTTFTIMRVLPREVDPQVYEMLHEDPGDVSFSSVGGLNDQVRVYSETACCRQ